MMLNDILAALMPQMMELLAAAVTMLIGLAVKWFHDWTGIQIEAKHRDALHSAIMTGIRSAVTGGLPAEHVVDAAVQYARSSVPDAIGALKPSTAVLKDLALSKLGDLLGKT